MQLVIIESKVSVAAVFKNIDAGTQFVQKVVQAERFADDRFSLGIAVIVFFRLFQQDNRRFQMILPQAGNLFAFVVQNINVNRFCFLFIKINRKFRCVKFNLPGQILGKALIVGKK